MLQIVLLAVAAVGALNLLVAAVVIGGRDDAPELPSDIESVIPAPNAVIRPQEDVGADLADTFTGVLFIDGVELPEDQLRFNKPLGQVSFRPGAENEIARLAPGRHSATIEYWPQDRTRAASKSFTWQFTAG